MVHGIPREYVAYRGMHFTIEWYYSEKGESAALEYYLSLEAADRLKVLMLFKMICDLGYIPNIQKFRNEGNKIYAFKPQPHRFLCFFAKDQKIILTHAFRKQHEKLRVSDMKFALRCMHSYLLRVKQGIYYEQNSEED